MADGGMMQMRINFLFEAMGEGGTTPLTFADLANDAAGMQAVLKSANHANSDFDEHHQIAAKLLGYESDPITGVTEDADRFPKTVAALPGLATQPITLVAELQLHLSHYLVMRKRTHLWFKIQRAVTLSDLRRDCTPHRYS